MSGQDTHSSYYNFIKSTIWTPQADSCDGSIGALEPSLNVEGGASRSRLVQMPKHIQIRSKLLQILSVSIQNP